MVQQSFRAWWRWSGSRSALVFALFFWGWLPLVWLVVPSSVLIAPDHVEISGTTVRVHRTYPLHEWLGIDRPLVRYVETVRPAPDGLPICVDTATFRHSSPNLFGEWDIADWAAPCMTVPYIWRAEWTAYLFDLIPLRPVALELPVYEATASAAAADPCPWRISTAGIIHGPDSPYRAMTPPSRCYATEAAARAALQEGSP